MMAQWQERPIPVAVIDTFQGYRVSNLWWWYRLILALIVSYLFLGEIGIVPSICAKVLESYVSCEPNIVQPSVYDQPKCPPNLKVKKKKIIIINQRSFIICQKNAGISIRDFCSGRTCSFYVLPQETAISVEAHTVDGQRPVTKVALRVNGTQISIWYIPTGKTGLPLQKFRFHWDDPFTSQPQALVIGRKYDYE